MIPRGKARYSPKQRTADQRRSQVLQILTMRENIDTLTAADLVRWTGLGEPECAAMLEHQRLLRRARG